MPAPRVEATDTVAAGDTFCGVYAASLAQGLDERVCLERACAAASLAVQRPGAQASVPTVAEVDQAGPGGLRRDAWLTTSTRWSLGPSTDHDRCRWTRDVTWPSSTGARSSPRPTTRPTGRRGATGSSAGASRPGSGSAFDGGLYDRPDLAWASRCYVISQVWLWDELLYDAEQQRFTPDRLLADAQERFGGFDAVVLWHAYPVIGLDDRNQWDFYRDVDGLAELVADLHAAGVKVFVDYNPWDTGTRRSRDDATELAALVADLDIDGVFLDTLKEGGTALLDGLAAARAGVAVEGESTLPLERLADHPLSWAQWFADSPVPGVVRSHWFERRHQMHHVRRWHRDHAEELQSAWLNGIGVMVWEVVFGVWVGWSDRDAQTLRRMSRAQRALHHLFVAGDWTPLVDLGEFVRDAGVFGSTFASGSERVTVLANRSDTEATVPVAVSAEHGARRPLDRSPADPHRGGRLVGRARPRRRRRLGGAGRRRPRPGCRADPPTTGLGGVHAPAGPSGAGDTLHRGTAADRAWSSPPASTSSPCGTATARRGCTPGRRSSTSGSRCTPRLHDYRTLERRVELARSAWRSPHGR